MYKIVVITKYYIFKEEVESLNCPKALQLFNQPDIVEIRAEQIEKVKKLIKEVKHD